MADNRASEALIIAGIALSIKFPEDTDYTQVAEVTSYPQVGGTSENVDVTTIFDKQKVYVAGLPDPGQGSLEVNFVGRNPQHQKLFEAQYKVPKDTVMLKIENTDGTGFEWPAEIGGVQIGGGAPGTALTGTISFSFKGEVTPTWPTDTP